MTPPFFQSKTQTLLLSGFTAGTLDILAAIFILANGNVDRVLRYIAQGAIGGAAFEGGPEMLLLGAAIHYTIAYCYAIGYFVVFPYVPILHTSIVASGIFYGAFVWAFMQFVVLPMTQSPPGPLTLAGALPNILILMAAIGLPIAWITSTYYERVL